MEIYYGYIIIKFDIISIFSDPRDKRAQTVNIGGAVFYPGDYPILSNSEKVGDIIQRAGGFLPEAFPMGSTFKRANMEINLSFDKINNNSRDKENFNIMPNDSIFIATKTNTVQIIGEVNQPGVYKFYDGYNLSKYIELAGGLTVNAQKKEIWVSYPNGTSKQLKRFTFSPKVIDSSVISVGSKPEVEPLDKTEFAKELASIISDFLQIALTIAVISNSAGT